MINADKIQSKTNKPITIKNIFLLILIVLSIISCDNDNEVLPIEMCNDDGLLGEYLFYSESDTSSHKIEIIFLEANKFQTNGIYGYGFWFPPAPLSGEINDCQILLDEYENVERIGLPSPGGFKRYYYESMSGYGEYYPENDSIILFLTYERTGSFPEYFSGEVFLRKVE